MGKRNYLKALLLITALLSNTMTVKADTAKDIFDVYSLNINTESDKAEKSVGEAEKAYKSVVKEYAFTDLYNTAVMLTNSKEVTDQLYEYQARCKELETKMLSNFDAPLSEILSDENEYVSKIEKTNYLLKAMDSYSGIVNSTMPESDLYKLQQEYETAKDSLEDILEKSEIGVVEGVIHPIQTAYSVASAYGTRAKVSDPSKTEFHNGIDLSAEIGTGVLSAFSGIVTFSDYDENSGETIRINHGNGIVTEYSNLRDRYVKSGDSVKQYQKIGAVGNTSKEDGIGSNLHLSLYINNKSYDPSKLYEKEVSK